MELAETYKRVRESIVAFTPKYIPLNSPDEKPPDFPPIIGTGFIVEDGLIATNDHVIQALTKLPKPPNTQPEDWGFIASLFHEIPGKGMARIQLEVLGVFAVRDLQVDGYYYGPRKPDMGFVLVKAKGLPKLLADSRAIVLEEGREVATAGFPMGTDALMAPGYLHQLTPTLQKGIISAVLPFCCETPHAFTINVMVQGGASGSPVFPLHSPVAIGILYAGLNDLDVTKKNKDVYRVPTNISYIVPAHFLERSLEVIRTDPSFQLPPDTKSLSDIISSAKPVILKQKGYSQPTPVPSVQMPSQAKAYGGEVVKLTPEPGKQ